MHPIGYTVDCDLCRPVAGIIPLAAETECVLSRRLFSMLPLCNDRIQSSACRRVTRHNLQRTRPQLRYRLRPGLLA